MRSARPGRRRKAARHGRTAKTTGGRRERTPARATAHEREPDEPRQGGEQRRDGDRESGHGEALPTDGRKRDWPGRGRSRRRHRREGGDRADERTEAGHVRAVRGQAQERREAQGEAQAARGRVTDGGTLGETRRTTRKARLA